MASSLFNDQDNVDKMIENFIDVADLLYGKYDPLLIMNNDIKNGN